MKSHRDKVTDFQDVGISKVDSNYSYLAVISLDSAAIKDGNYYPQVFLKECIYFEKRVIIYIIDDLESFSDNSNDFDE